MYVKSPTCTSSPRQRLRWGVIMDRISVTSSREKNGTRVSSSSSSNSSDKSLSGGSALNVQSISISIRRFFDRSIHVLQRVKGAGSSPNLIAIHKDGVSMAGLGRVRIGLWMYEQSATYRLFSNAYKREI